MNMTGYMVLVYFVQNIADMYILENKINIRYVILTINLNVAIGTWKCKWCDRIFETRKKLSDHKKEEHAEHANQIWNKGLTKEIDNRIKKASETLRSRYKNGEIIPSFLGKKHTAETKEKMSKIQSLRLENSNIGRFFMYWLV